MEVFSRAYLSKLPVGVIAAFGVLFASICFGLVPYFSRGLTEQGMAPQAVAFYRYVIAATLMLPSLLGQRHAWRTILWGIAAGLVMGLGWVSYVTALETVPVSTVGVLYMTYPVFTLVLARLIFGEAPSLRAVIAALAIVAAAIIASSPGAVSTEHIPALIISLGAPFGFGFGICVLVHKLWAVPAFARMGAVSLGSIIGLLPLVLGTEAAALFPRSMSGWGLVVGIGVLTAIIPQLIFTICAPIVGASRSALLGAVELPTMFLVGFFAFGEQISGSQVIAGAIIVGAMVFSRSRITKNVTTNMVIPKRRR